MKTGECEVTTFNVPLRNTLALYSTIKTDVCDVTSAVLPNVGYCITPNLLLQYFTRGMPLYIYEFQSH